MGVKSFSQRAAAVVDRFTLLAGIPFSAKAWQGTSARRGVDRAHDEMGCNELHPSSTCQLHFVTYVPHRSSSFGG
ncbi:hypothetical protein KIN20_010097 [Parelaphostrongylus tenuis]|uniref:Uncharacterized protein n=1 Tax=Parelaphostrongylus tenuis TaxID=148309 RepID=A0AAD5MST4_PARTN|nr:hypothetical protein KIN20_010097 [Parelaphostrongylus tenuis]